MRRSWPAPQASAACVTNSSSEMRTTFFVPRLLNSYFNVSITNASRKPFSDLPFGSNGLNGTRRCTDSEHNFFQLMWLNGILATLTPCAELHFFHRRTIRNIITKRDGT